jgi:PST family polysaccharide transporter
MDLPENPRTGTTGSRHNPLTTRTLDAFLWTFSGAGFQAVLRIAVLAILARLLLPTDFGIVGAALAVVALADLFTQVGVAPSIVQAPSLTSAHIRTAFSVTALMGIVVSLLISWLASYVAAAFRMPQMEPVVRTFCIIFVARGFAAIAEAVLQREMRFREIAMNAVWSYFFGYAVCSVALALAGFGIWALVVGLVMQNVLSSIGFVLRARHSMRPLFDLANLRHLVVFGTGLTLARIGNYLATNADTLVVGRWLGAEALGFYSRAYLLLMQPAQLFGSAADKVMFPAMASIQQQEDRLERSYHRAVALIALATLPLSGAIVALAPEVVFLLLGERWSSVVFPLQILVAALFFRTAYKMTVTLLRSRGAVYRLAAWQWIYGVCIALGAWLGQSHGITGVAIGVSIAITISFWTGVLIVRTTVAISPVKIAALLARYGLLMVVLGLSVWAMKRALLPLALHPVATLIAGGGLCLIVSIALWFFVPKLFGEEGDWVRVQIASRLAPSRRG